jgi:hypothetical protein
MNTERFEVYFNSPLGIEDQFTDNCRISVLPGKIEVSGSDKEIYSACLYTIDGKLISTSKGSLSDGISLILAKQGLGICILKLNNGNNSITRKVYLN